MQIKFDILKNPKCIVKHPEYQIIINSEKCKVKNIEENQMYCLIQIY